MKYQRRNPSAKSSGRSREIAFVASLVLLTMAAYWSIHTHEFIRFDDQVYVTENPHVLNGLTIEGIVWAFTTGYGSNWHPLTWMSHMVDVSLFGLDAGLHHLVNLLIHIINSVLVFVLFRRMTGMFWQSAILAAVFSLHPFHVESVAWASERKDVLSTMFGLLAIIAYVAYVRRPALRRFSLVLLAFAFSLMAKPMFVTLPVILLLLDFWPLRRLYRGRDNQKPSRQNPKTANGPDLTLLLQLLREKIPLLVLSGVSSVVTILVQREGGAVESWDVLPLTSRISNALLSYVQYGVKTIWPSNLALFYPYPTEFLIPYVAGSALLLVACSVWVIFQRNHHPYLAGGWCLYLVSLVPVIGLIQVGTQAMADRYMYFPILGVLVMIIWGVSSLKWRNPRRNTILAIVSFLAVGILFVQTRIQAGHWRNTETIMTHTASVIENNWTAHSNLGLLYSDQGRVAEADTHLREAMRIRPDHPESHINLGNLLRQLGKMDEALSYYREALRIKPSYAEAHNNIGVVLFNTGHAEEAISHYAEALQLKPDLANAHFNMGLALATTGRLEEAIQHYEEALRINPLYAEAHNNLGVAYYTRRDLKSAIVHYQQAVKIQPGNAQAHNNLGVALRESGQPTQAITHFREAVRLAPGYEQARINLDMTVTQQREHNTR